MANTINDLYLKYTNKVGKTLENDRYFQYLFEMVQAGANTIEQKNQILHKVVDEKWLTTIEESLDAINTIIDKPRRFIATKEEVVPVALAKKITADSVRHLSMNTQFIASDEDEEVYPTRILNVSTEESYDLYENRFIYHLIQRLVAFVDKRTDVIFWSTGDERRNTLVMESKVDDAYEEIEYKIQMNVKNRQSFAENDSDNMEVFMRIDRVRRLVMALRNSPFCKIMAGCAKVRSPIQRTNLMMKDPYYRSCYKLWQFLESYDEVGYSIEVRDSALEFDEEYLLQMYTNLITNYTVFKSLLETDGRQAEELAQARRRKVVKPKFIKQIKEQFVEDYNLPDVEIRRVFVEEVTQAQLDAEAKLAEETAHRESAEKAEAEAQRQLQEIYWQLNEQMMQNARSQEELESAQTELSAVKEELSSAQAAQEKIQEELVQSQEELGKVQTDLVRSREEVEKTQAILEETQERYESAQSEHRVGIEHLQSEHAAELEKTQAEHTAELEKMQAEHVTELEDARSQHIAELEKMRSECIAELEDTRSQHAAELEDARSQHAAELEKTQAEHTAELEKMRSEYIAELEDTRSRHAAELEKTQAEHAAAAEETREKHVFEMQENEDRHTAELREIGKKQEMELQELKEKHFTELQEIQESAKKQIREAEESKKSALQTQRMAEEDALRIREEADSQIAQIKSEAGAEIQRIKEETDTVLKRSKKETEKVILRAQKAVSKAEAKAEGNRLSKYIIAAWNERREQKQTETRQTRETEQKDSGNE